MARYRVCGIDYDGCKVKTAQNYAGCKKREGNIFWGKCELHQYNAQKKQGHCGNCQPFPCDK